MYVMDIQTTGSVGVSNRDEGILERILDSGVFYICWDDAGIGEWNGKVVHRVYGDSPNSID
jgi:hypothetical protein